jgi:hypothetical protein
MTGLGELDLDAAGGARHDAPRPADLSDARADAMAGRGRPWRSLIMFNEFV